MTDVRTARRRAQRGWPGRAAALVVVALVVALVVAGCGSSGPGSRGSTSPAASGSPLSGRPAPGGTAPGSTAPGGTAPARTAPGRPPTATPTALTPALAHAEWDDARQFSGCQVDQQVTSTKLCHYATSSHPVLTVAVVGDSVAGQWLGPLAELAQQRGWEIVTDLHSRCPWTATMTVNTGSSAPYTACQQWGRNALDDVLDRIHPQVVVTSDRPTVGTLQHAPGPAAFAEIGAGMATYWRVLLSHGIAVVPIEESPELGVNEVDCLAHRSVAACSVPASTAFVVDPPTVVATRLVGAQVHLVDLNPVICPDGRCSPVVDDYLKFRDDHHLTNTYALHIEPQFAAALLGTGSFSR